MSALVLAACASPVAPSAVDGPIATTEPTPVPTKPPPDSSAAFIGWIDGSPTVGIRDPGPPASWNIRSHVSSGWKELGNLPDGPSPVTDGATAATVLDPEAGPGVAIATPGQNVRPVVLPNDPWVAMWRGIQGLVPLAGRTGYLLAGGAAIGTLDDNGALHVTRVPDGYVALAPTSDPDRFLLATEADASEPYALSEASRFAAYLWTVGSDRSPTILSPVVVAVAPSTVGLAWVRTDDGSWWSVASDETVRQVSQPNPDRTDISPDGHHVLLSSDRTMGCAPTAIDPCPVRLIDDSGSVQTFVGPLFGGLFHGDDVGMVLDIRPSLHLPWRLVSGPTDQPATIGID